MRSYFVHYSQIYTSCATKIVFLFFALFLLPQITFAATLSFAPAFGSYAVGSVFTVGVYVDSGTKALNAVSGVVSYPQDLLEMVSISKNQSVVSLWVQEPTFSNTAGTARFEGIVLNPGFVGSSGKVLTYTFKVTAQGNPKLSFASGSVLANDGEGTELLQAKRVAQYTVTMQAPALLTDTVVPDLEKPLTSTVAGVPKIPELHSVSNPVGVWSKEKNGSFNFIIPASVTASRLLLDTVLDSEPVIVYSPAIPQREIKDLPEGLSYLHAQYKNEYGWGEILHYTLQVDTQSPTDLTVAQINPKTFAFEATDILSGISRYQVRIDAGETTEHQSSGSYTYTLPQLTRGEHVLMVRVFDAAGNSTSTTLAFTTQNEFLKVEPGSDLPVPFQSESSAIAVGLSIITVLSVLIPCIALVLLLGVLLFATWRSVGGLRTRIDKEVLEARMIVHKAFSILRNDLEVDIATLKKANEKRKLTKEESKILKRLQKNIDEAEKVISKEVLDIEKQVR